MASDVISEGRVDYTFCNLKTEPCTVWVSALAWTGLNIQTINNPLELIHAGVNPVVLFGRIYLLHGL